MKTKEYTSLGVTVPFAVPESVDEFDKNAKRSGACLDEATNNVIYRGSLAEFRDLLIHGRDAVPATDSSPAVPAFKGLETLTMQPRKVKTEKKGDKEIETYDESEQEYINRVFGHRDTWNDVVPTQLASTAKAAAVLVAFDASATERKAKAPAKLAEKWKTTALDFLNGKKNLAKLGDAFKKFNVGPFVPLPAPAPATDPKNVEALGWLCKAYADAQDAFKAM